MPIKFKTLYFVIWLFYRKTKVNIKDKIHKIKIKKTSASLIFYCFFCLFCIFFDKSISI